MWCILQDIVRYILLAIAVLIAFGMYTGIREAYPKDADDCDEEFPGDSACDQLRERGDEFIPAMVCMSTNYCVYNSYIYT